jgi:hypothetical protein
VRDTFYSRAACAGLTPETFFEHIWDEDDEGNSLPVNEDALAKAISICSGCPVRVECFLMAMDDEDGAADARRHGLRGGVTPSQRYSIWRRDCSRCIQCNEPYDPLGLVAGDIVCSCGSFTEPEIPAEGDTWYPRHDALLAKLIAYLLERTEPGDRILPPYRMLLELGHRRKDDLPLCYERLIDDGLITRGEGRGVYFRAAGRQALATWVAPARRHAARSRGPAGPPAAA